MVCMVCMVWYGVVWCGMVWCGMVWYACLHVCVKLCKYLSISISGSQPAIWEINVGPTWTSEEFPKWSKLPPMVWRRKRAERIPVPVAEWWAKPWRNPWRNAWPTKYGSLKYLKHLEATHIESLGSCDIGWIFFNNHTHTHSWCLSSRCPTSIRNPSYQMQPPRNAGLVNDSLKRLKPLELSTIMKYSETMAAHGTINPHIFGDSAWSKRSQPREPA